MLRGLVKYGQTDIQTEFTWFYIARECATARHRRALGAARVRHGAQAECGAQATRGR